MSARVVAGVLLESAEGVGASWDYYSASLEPEVSGDEAFDGMRVALGGQARRVAGKQGYGVRDELLHGDRVVCSVSHGASHGRPLFLARGGGCVDVVPVFRNIWPRHDVVRADSRVDFTGPGTFDRLVKVALGVADRHRLKTSTHGDWFNKKDGRTLYVGSRTSENFVRLYEKGIQLRSDDRDHTRLELEFKPKKAPKRRAAARLAAGQVWGMSRWAQDLAECVTGADITFLPMSEWRVPDDVRAENALIAQYARLLVKRTDEGFGGDGAAYGAHLVEQARLKLDGKG